MAHASRIPELTEGADRSVEVCIDTDCGNPIVNRNWLRGLEHAVETRPSVTIRGVCGHQQLSEWATLSFYIDGANDDGSITQTAKFTTSAWVQDELTPIALLGTAFTYPYQIDVLTTKRQLRVGTLKDFYVPFELIQPRRSVIRRVEAVQRMVIPAGHTRRVPVTWKELPGGRSFAFHGSIPSATSSLVDKAPARGSWW